MSFPVIDSVLSLSLQRFKDIASFFCFLLFPFALLEGRPLAINQCGP